MFLDTMLSDLRHPIKRNNYGGTEHAVAEFLEIAPEAMKFDFGDMILERVDTAPEGIYGQKRSVYKLPALTDDEWSMWHDGLLPLPFPTCWFEFKINGVESALLIMTKNGMPNVQRVEPRRSYVPGMIDGVWTKSIDNDRIEVWSNDPLTHAYLKVAEWDFVNSHFGASPGLMVYLTLMINSQTTELRKVEPTAKHNRLRRLRGKSPDSSHTVVTIVPKRFIVEGGEPGDAKGTSPRLHWRRSHIRTLRRDQPDEKKIVIPRFLVGRRELGEITHDYRVRTCS